MAENDVTYWYPTFYLVKLSKDFLDKMKNQLTNPISEFWYGPADGKHPVRVLVAFAMEPERPVKATVSYEMVTKD